LPSVHRRGYVIELGSADGRLLELIVVGQFKGQVVSMPATWINQALIWLFNIRFESEPGVYIFATVINK